MARTETRSLFALDYRVRLVVGLWDTLEVRNADGKIYRVQPRRNQCSCPATKVCKHLTDLQALVSEQAQMWAELQAQERDNVIGERLDRLAWNLLAVSERIWGGGEMSIDRRYEGGAAVMVRPECGTAAAAQERMAA